MKECFGFSTTFEFDGVDIDRYIEPRVGQIWCSGLSGAAFVIEEECLTHDGKMFLLVRDDNYSWLNREQFDLFSLVYVGEL